MFDRILNMPYIHNPNQVTGFYVTNSNNSTKHVQTSCQKSLHSIYKTCIFQKNPKKPSSWKKILSWVIWDFFIFQQKHALTCPSLYSPIFHSLYHTSLISSKWEIDETVHFWNFYMLFTNKFAVFVGISGSHFQTGKMKRSERLHEACCNGHHLHIGEVNVTTGR